MKYKRATTILIQSERKLNELVKDGYKIVSIYQYKDSMECNTCSIIYRDKYWFEKLFTKNNC